MLELPQSDLAEALDRSRGAWRDLKGADVFLTGVTGFIGSWLLESLLFAEQEMSLGVKTTILVRDANVFRERFPHLASSKKIELHVGDVRAIDPPRGAFSHVIHSASAVPPKVASERPNDVVDLIERGTQRVLEAAVQARATRVLLVSSGSVYGPQPANVERIEETYTGTADPGDPAQRFGVAKRRAEQIGETFVAKGVGVVSARVFALIGPRLPLDGQFALGQFLADAKAGRPVTMSGDGSPVRSWMYMADLVAWCWTMLAQGKNQPYNVGSEEILTIGEAAHRVAKLPVTPVTVLPGQEPHPGVPPSRYVPSTRRAHTELGLEAWTKFDDALARTWNWLTT